jgi:adenosylcobinamide kinase/adenosylcobinamide-phosphate guanylyltransferase
MGVHLVLGGARSGKSSHAERLALAADGPLHYVATAETGDDEMRARVAHHRATRSSRFATHEETLDLAGTLVALDGPDETVVVDCLTLWLTNWLVGDPEGWPAARDALLEALPSLASDVLLVSNEVGQGVVPMGALSRRFVDEAGWLHQDLAALADRVTFVVAGLPQRLK